MFNFPGIANHKMFVSCAAFCSRCFFSQPDTALCLSSRRRMEVHLILRTDFDVIGLFGCVPTRVTPALCRTRDALSLVRCMMAAFRFGPYSLAISDISPAVVGPIANVSVVQDVVRRYIKVRSNLIESLLSASELKVEASPSLLSPLEEHPALGSLSLLLELAIVPSPSPTLPTELHHPPNKIKSYAMPARNILQLARSLDKQATAALLPDKQAPLSKALSHALENTAAKGLPPIEISPLQGQYLAIQAQLISAKNILEIGTLGGYSTIWFASTGAHVTSLEINPKHREVALENVKNAGYENSVDVILGPALETMPELLQQGKKFDLIFIDASWGEQWEYFQFAVKLAHPGTCIYTDNVVRTILEGNGSGSTEETLFSKVGRLEGIQTTLVSVVSGHKPVEEEAIDGFLLALVK